MKRNPNPNIEEADSRVRDCINQKTISLDLSRLHLTELPETLLENLAELGHLTMLNLSHNQMADISALSALMGLTNLYLSGNQIADISALSTLTGLTELNLTHNQIADISALSTLTGLTELNLTHNQIADISALSALMGLTNLYLSGNQIADISALSALMGLTNLYLWNNQIADISALSTLTGLIELNLTYNQIADISALKNLTKLTSLWLDNNQIADISALSTLTGLTELNLAYNQIVDISALSTLMGLTTLYLSDNQIVDISALSTLTGLADLNLAYNQIVDISALSTLMGLTTLYLSDNQLADIEHLQLLENLENLKSIWFHDNPVYDQLNLSFEPNAAQINELKLAFEKLAAQELISVDLPEKIVLLGNHASGKSSTVHYLAHETYCNTDESTHVLNIVYLNTATDPKQSNTEQSNANALPLATCYDFGGQDFYHGVYRIFLQQADNILLLLNPQTNRNYRDRQNPQSEHASLKNQKTHYFNLSYWCGLLGYMQYQPTDISTSKHTRNNHPSDDHFPQNVPQQDNLTTDRQQSPQHSALTATLKGYDIALVQSHARTNKADWSMPALISERLGNAVQISGFYHLDLQDDAKYNNNAQHKRSLDNFRDEFLCQITEKRTRSIMPTKEHDFLIKLIEQQQELYTKTEAQENQQYGHEPTVLSEVGKGLDNLLSDSALVTQMIQYTRKGLVLYDETLTVNQNSKLQEHIVWLNPKALVKYIHEHLLPREVISEYKGKIPKTVFDEITENLEGGEHIIELLQHHQVIFEHHHADSAGDANEASKREYIIPNYLPFADSDVSYELASFGMATADVRLQFEDFIPMGLINQFINHFGRQPDKKLFWRDCMVFTLTDDCIENSQPLKHKIMLQIDMSRLFIDVFVDTPAGARKQTIISYLFYCIMSAYWSYKTNTNPVSLDDFMRWQARFADLEKHLESHGFERRVAHQLGNRFDLDSVIYGVELVDADSSDKEKIDEQLSFFIKLFNRSDNYIPADMYISRNGTDFVKATELIAHHDDDIMIASYQLTEVLSAENRQPHYHSVTLQQAKNAIAVHDFQPFITRRFKKMANIFLSYSRKDISYKEALFDHLGLLRRAGHNVYDCTQNNAEKWDKRIQDELEQADIVVFLLSVNFFNSDYIFHDEMTKVLERNQADGKSQTIVPILVRDFDLNMLSALATEAGLTTETIAKLSDLPENSREKNTGVLAELGSYQFMPYYRDERNYNDPVEYLLPIEKWPECEKQTAYKNIAQQIHKEINQLSD